MEASEPAIAAEPSAIDDASNDGKAELTTDATTAPAPAMLDGYMPV